MRVLTALAAGAALVSCKAVGPDYRAPSAPTPASYDVGEQPSLAPEDVALWWEGFGDEQLSSLVESALASNLDLLAAVERVEAARAAYGVVSADRLPTLTGTASYTRVKTLGAPTRDQWSLGAQVAWEVDLFGRVRRAVEASHASFEAEVEQVRGVQVALAAETVATYLQALSIQERLDIAAYNVDGQRRSLDIADRRFDAGMAAGLDPAQARVNLHSTQASVPALELQMQRALHRLAVLTGKDPRSLVGSLQTVRPLPEVPEQLMVGLPADLLRNRPDIRGLERELAAQTARVGVATAALYPSVNLTGAWDWLAQDPDELFERDSRTGSLGFPVSVPIFNAGRLRSQVSAEEAVVRQIHLQLRQRILVAQEEVENALVAIVRDRRQAELLAEAVEAARSSVDLSRQLYTSGQSDFQNVLDAQRSLFALEDDLARAKLNTLLDLVDLYRAIGGGWTEGEPADDPAGRMP